MFDVDKAMLGSQIKAELGIQGYVLIDWTKKSIYGHSPRIIALIVKNNIYSVATRSTRDNDWQFTSDWINPIDFYNNLNQAKVGQNHCPKVEIG
jgi:hypothetical protein